MSRQDSRKTTLIIGVAVALIIALMQLLGVIDI